MSHKKINPKGWKPARGYANAILSEGLTLNIAGQIGWNENQEFISKDFLGQMEQTLKNISVIVNEAGGKITDLTRLTWYVTDKAEYVSNQKKVGEVYRKILGNHFPAMTMVVVSALVEDEALIEIEATAIIPN
ncbi:RidA family protein [Paracoccaceae bacterium]|jgi:enamine deaminase RidA (YjgF/YER057c/UK114 family)|nr:RidA family protein [Paracoccaceae bacterium]MDA9123168.1 RidA family protein [Paracoccaceae bacterium]MDA9229142.1 RidA family protein [Paracoccaceae bacterium]|tara:strand:+ start:734 stop:1132 length:399 start_codon:yes stop_codon:yes gene_type:complete